MTPAEQTHFAVRLADLFVAAVRATSVEQLAGVRAEIANALADAFALLDHDARPAPVLPFRDRDDWSVKV